MRAVQVSIGVVLAAFALGGCKKAAAPEEWFGLWSGQGHARYAGVGIYSPGAEWTKMVTAQQSKDTAAAQLVDDSAVIVVVDSHTGEVRGCGDMTGYCVGMNPWKAPLPAGQMAPVSLTDHAKSSGAASSAPAAAAERG
jgi:hypothetical protein